MSGLYKRLSSLTDLRIPGFEKSVPPGKVYQLAFDERPSQEWFAEFVEKACSAIGKYNLPIFRVSDGEFYFSVGYRIPYPLPGQNPILHYIRQAASYIKWSRRTKFWSGTPGYGYEFYSGEEWRNLQKHYINCLHQIVAENGLLAMALIKVVDRFGEPYHKDICAWFDSNNINVNRNNYYPFYFVYGLLVGSARKRVLENKNILVVTSLNPKKQEAIRKGLADAGAASIQFIPISRDRALTDKIDLSELIQPVDVALIGAGVGAANILVQLKDLNTLCIDAGYCLDLIAEPERAGSRDFTVTDDEM